VSWTSAESGRSPSWSSQRLIVTLKTVTASWAASVAVSSSTPRSRNPRSIASFEFGRRDRLERVGDQQHRAQRSRGVGREPCDQRGEFLIAREEHLALVGEVAEEGACREAGARGDLRDGRRREALLDEQRDRCLLQPIARVWPPSPHIRMLLDDMQCRQVE